jgi:hypothetical protein
VTCISTGIIFGFPFLILLSCLTENYLTYFYPPSDRKVIVKSTHMSQLLRVSASSSVIATQCLMPAILITILITASIGTAVFFIVLYNRKIKKAVAGSTPKFDLPLYGLILVELLNVITYLPFYKFSPFDAAANTVFATALIAPMAEYIFETPKSKT